MREMHKAESAQKLIEVMTVHYNFVRLFSILGKTPAEQAGVRLEFGRNKIESQIKVASS